MPRFLKFAALTAGAMLLMLLAAAAIVSAVIDPNDYKSDIIRLAADKHQRTLAIPGNVKLMLYPRIGANLGAVSLSERGGKQEFAAIDSARISVALLPLLLRQEVVIDRIDIRGMRASVVRFANGSMNTGDLTAPREAPVAGTRRSARAPIRLAIDNIRVDNANLLFDDRKSGRTLEISHLNIDSGAIARGVPSTVALSANVRASRPAVSTAITLTSSFMPDPELRRIAFSDIDANLDLSFKDARVHLKGQLDVDLDRDEFATEMFGSFDESRFDLKAGFRAGAHHLTLHVDKLDLGRYQDRLVPDAAPNDPAIVEAGDAFDLSPLSILVASGGIHVAELKVGTIHATNVRAALRSGGGKFVLQPIVGNLYGGTGRGSLALDFSRSASIPRITFVHDFRDVQVGQLMHDLLGKTPVAGRGDLLIDVNTEGSSTAQMRRALAGTASLRVTDGVVNGIDLATMVLGAKAADGLARAGDTTTFLKLAASFTIANGIAHNDDLAATAALFSVAGAGDIDLAAEKLDATLACTAPLADLTLPVKLNGSWDAVRWRVDTDSVSGAAVKQKARDKLKKTIRGLLKR